MTCFRCRRRARYRLRCEVPLIGDGIFEAPADVCWWHRWTLGRPPIPLVRRIEVL